MSQPRPLSWLRASQSVSNSFMLSAKAQPLRYPAAVSQDIDKRHLLVHSKCIFFLPMVIEGGGSSSAYSTIAAKRWETCRWLLLSTNRKSHICSPTAPIYLTSEVNLNITRISKSYFSWKLLLKWAELAHMLLLNTNRKSYMGSPSHMKILVWMSHENLLMGGVFRCPSGLSCYYYSLSEREPSRRLNKVEMCMWLMVSERLIKARAKGKWWIWECRQ